MKRRDLFKLSALMLGGALSPSCSRAVDSGADLHADSKGQLDDAQFLQISTLCELVIPTTDTPGAIAAGVPDFVTNIVAGWYTDAERAAFLAGLSQLDHLSLDRFGVTFAAAGVTEQQTLLSEEMAAAGEPGSPSASGPVGEKAFFYMLRELVVLGYFTSEIGATQALTYLPMPGRYDGAYPLADVGTNWSS